MSEPEIPPNKEVPDHTSTEPTSPAPDFDDPIAYRDLSERLPNEALRDELESMTPEEEAEFLRRLEELSNIYLGPGGP